MDQKKKVVSFVNTKEDQNRSIRTELTDQEQKQKLLKQIAMLRTYVSVLEHHLETPKFGQLQLAREVRLLSNDEAATNCNMLDMRTEMRSDLYRFIGIRCTNCKHRFVFEIANTDGVTWSDPYVVEILIDEYGRGKLGKWILPMSVDVQEILSQYPIDDLNNIRQFLKSCKHHVDCYICRAEQLKKLQNCLAEIKNARVTHTVGFAQVELAMSEVKDIKSNAVHNVTLHLCYKSTEVRPYKLLSDTDGNERPLADLVKKLNKHFKPFLMNDLISAFQRIVELQIDFLWKPIAADENQNNLETLDESLEENMGFLFAYVHRDNKKQKRGKNKDKNSAAHVNKTETEKCEGIDIKANKKKQRDFLPDSKKTEPHKYEQSTKTTTNLLGQLKKLPDNLKKIEKKISDAGQENDRCFKVYYEKDKPESKATNAMTYDRRRAKSKKHQTNIENRQMQSNILSKADDKRDGKGNLPINASDTSKKLRKRKLLKKSNDPDLKGTQSPQRTRKRKKVITQVDERGKENLAILNQNERNRETQSYVSSSTPLKKKLPDKQKFFHASRISEISKIKENNAMLKDLA